MSTRLVWLCSHYPQLGWYRSVRSNEFTSSGLPEYVKSPGGHGQDRGERCVESKSMVSRIACLNIPLDSSPGLLLVRGYLIDEWYILLGPIGSDCTLALTRVLRGGERLPPVPRIRVRVRQSVLFSARTPPVLCNL